METWAGFWLLAVLLVAAPSFTQTQAQTVVKYFKVGGDLQLSPVPVSEQIYSIVWKCDKNLLAEWVEGPIPLIYYSKFRGRSELNTDTGVLVIHSMTADDTGVYSVEINNNVQSRVYQAVEIQEVPQPVVKYFRVGGELQLSPVPVSGQIYSIVWKCDKNLLAEWVKGSIDLTYYSKFRGRSELNTTTGELLVLNMTADDTGVYSVEINNNVRSRVYQAVVIQEVPQPVVDLQPLACTRVKICRLKCHGDIANAGPVSYFWKKDDGRWEQSGDRKELSDEEMDSVKTFSCRMKNPVSEKDSEPFRNPFYRE